MVEPLVTVVVLTWNSRQHIDGFLTTMLEQTYTNYQILVVDSCSDDDTAAYIQTNYPTVQVVELDQNMGYRRGNSFGMKLAKGEFIVICNDDVEADSGCLAAMVKVMQQDNYIGLVTPMILFAKDEELVNSAGNTLHFSGMYGPRGKGEPRQRYNKRQTLSAVSGCCFMIRRDLMHRLGGFSTDFDQLDTGWHASFEDVDLCWRAQMIGYRIEYVPSSIMYHKYKQPDLFPSRFGSYEWGRYLTICRNYSLSTLLMLVPFLVALEMMSWAYALSKGRAYLIAKARVMRWILRHPRDIWTMRHRVQAVRTKPDFEIVSNMSPTLSLYQQLGGGKIARAIDSAFGLVSGFYCRALLAFLRAHSLFSKLFTTNR
jgi:GT2 family glycosyltransferase